MTEQQVTILKYRFTSNQLPPAFTLLDHMIDNIDRTLAKSNNIIEQNASSISTSDQLEKLSQVKHDIIQQSIITGDKMKRNFRNINKHELLFLFAKPLPFQNYLI
ncbi:unnamed protein product [Rotaria sordida]|uniref:Uncharacterized protein n=1 Tax=Rotaria sordida TaxID=392033 RepID=A0A819Z8R6_9BILA|nr:unnamed protein product [Rotaria sordida]